MPYEGEQICKATETGLVRVGEIVVGRFNGVADVVLRIFPAVAVAVTPLSLLLLSSHTSRRYRRSRGSRGRSHGHLPCQSRSHATRVGGVPLRTAVKSWVSYLDVENYYDQ